MLHVVPHSNWRPFSLFLLRFLDISFFFTDPVISGNVSDRIIAIFDVLLSSLPVLLQKEVFFTIDSVKSWVADGNRSSDSWTCYRSLITSSSLLSNADSSLDTFGIAGSKVACKCLFLMLTRDMLLMICDIREVKCASALCKSLFIVLFSVAKYINQLKKDFDTTGVDDIVRCVNDSPHYCFKIFFKH